MAEQFDESSTDGDLPTHLLVQKQMQDLIAIQKARVQRLEHDVSSQNETLRDSFIPKGQYETELNKLQESLRTDYVPREQYEMAVSELEEEKIEHAETRVRLKEVTDKLGIALLEIDHLKQQHENDRVAYQKACSAWKSKNVMETSKTENLRSKCTDISRHCEQQEDILSQKNEEIQILEGRLRAQEDLCRREVNEADIERKQQRYIAKMLEEQDRKKVRGMPQAVLKCKANRR